MRTSPTLQESPASGLPSLGGARLLRLEDGREIACQTLTEARFLYNDIFTKRIYSRHGVDLENARVIFDVGANIGLFTLFAGQEAPDAQIFSFEPAPPLLELLRRNAANFGVRCKIFPCGLSDHPSEAELTFYPNSSGMSSFHADHDEERQVLLGLMQNELEEGGAEMARLMEHADDLLAERLRTVNYRCRLRTLSEIIREHQVQEIDLIKIDVQKAELEVIRGIAEEHWPRIHQLVIELHNTEDQLAWLRAFLEERGFHVAAEQEEAYDHSVMFNVFASRSPQGAISKTIPLAVSARRNRLEQARHRAQRMKSAMKLPTTRTTAKLAIWRSSSPRSFRRSE